MASLRRINQDDLRNHNLSVVIDTLLRASGPMSRADLAKETGLTKATMSLLVSLLIDAGVVKEGEPQNSASYGRPSTPLMLGGGKVCGVGMQVNTDGYGCMASDAMAKAMAEDLESKRCIIAGVSCALPGLVTSDKRLLMARNLGWENVDLTTFDVMRGYDVTPCNEAKLAAIAQIPGYDSFLYLSCDIGIGGAIVRDGEIVSGSHGFAGEIGHVSVSLDGPLCGCGRRGCLETYAGRRALVEASGVAEKNAASSGEALERLLDAWHSHDVRTVEAVGRAIDALASAIGSALNLADVDTVLLGGWWTDFGPFFYETLENRLESQVLGASDMQVSVSIPLVADHPALYGAAEVGLRKFIDNPLTFITDKA